MNGRIFSSLLPACLCALLIAPSPAEAVRQNGAGQTDVSDQKEVVWGEMPAGARTAYIGIHGGTVPVSLLSAGDGSPMVAQVGLTGSDFLNFLRSKGKLEEELFLSDGPIPDPQGALPPEPPTPKLMPPEPASPPKQLPEGEMAASAQEPADTPADNATQPVEAGSDPVLATSPNATLALAGSPNGDIPVIYATGRAFERMSLVPENWAPFGLTEKALSVEGEIKVLATPKKMPRSQRKKRR